MAIVTLPTVYDAGAPSPHDCVVQQAFWNGTASDEYAASTGITLTFPGLKQIYGAVVLCSGDHAPLIKSISGNIVSVSLWKNANGTTTLAEMTDATALTNYDLRVIAFGK